MDDPRQQAEAGCVHGGYRRYGIRRDQRALVNRQRRSSGSDHLGAGRQAYQQRQQEYYVNSESFHGSFLSFFVLWERTLNTPIERSCASVSTRRERSASVFREC